MDGDGSNKFIYSSGIDPNLIKLVFNVKKKTIKYFQSYVSNQKEIKYLIQKLINFKTVNQSQILILDLALFMWSTSIWK